MRAWLSRSRSVTSPASGTKCPSPPGEWSAQAAKRCGRSDRRHRR